MSNIVKRNYEYMLKELRMSRNEFIQEEVLSARTEGRLMSGDATDKTIAKLVDYYNNHGADLYPHRVELEDFKEKDLSQSTKPKWKNEQVVGEYICFYLSGRGTGKPKAMILRITENKKHLLEACAIDIVQEPTKAHDLIMRVFRDKELPESREAHKILLDKEYSLLRGSRFLCGEVLGRDNLMSIILRDEHETYDMRISTSLGSYMNTYDRVVNKYSWRGGAAIASVCDLKDWPYSMIMGVIKCDLWHPDQGTADFCNALQRMHSYQKKENMLCLQNDIDSLWYEVFMDIHRRCER